MGKNLKKIERFVLQRLEINSRNPFSKLSKKVKKKQQLLSYTLKSLEKKEIIQSFYTLIDYSRFNSSNFRVFFKVDYLNEKKYEELISYLISNQYTSQIMTCSGQYDLICVFFAPNASQFNKVLRSIMEKFPHQLQNYMILTTIVNHELGKKYLFDQDMKMKDVIIGGDRISIEFDEIDYKILNLISQNSRINSVEISNKVGMTPRSIINRIRALEKKDVIKGYRPVLEIKNIGYDSSMVMIKYHNVSTEIELKLLSYLSYHPNIVCYTKVFGNHDLEVILDTQNNLELRKIEFEIRKKFAKLIQTIETISIFSLKKMNFFPEYLVK